VVRDVERLRLTNGERMAGLEPSAPDKLEVEASPVAVGRWVFIRHVEARDLNWAYDLLICSEASATWRFRSRALSPLEFHKQFWLTADVHLILMTSTAMPVGILQAYDYDVAGRTASVAMAMSPEVWNAGWPMEGVVLSIDFLFSSMGLRKIYFHIPAFNLGHVKSLSGWLLMEEAVLRDHDYHNRAHHALHILSLSSSDWADLGLGSSV
jgi:RimJ/RimL family protein N-acetyltransferase